MAALAEVARGAGSGSAIHLEPERPGPWNGCVHLRPLVAPANQVTWIGSVLADAEFASEHNHLYI
ncbi:MAG: hypothetical protein HY648_01630 [Acidobacteria bacterium]|nr:hypothetical protein [Acidobacteriota bacterium]